MDCRRLFLTLCLVTSCKSVTVDLADLACGEGCLDGYACHPFDGVCVPELRWGCGGGDAVCPSSVTEGSSCPSPGSFVPCADGATDCSQGCRTCENGLWGPCEGGGGCTLGQATSCATCDDNCLTSVHNATAVFCNTAGVAPVCDYVECASSLADVDDVRENGCECPLPGSAEICDGNDNDCNGAVDDVAPADLASQCDGLVAGDSHVSAWACVASACAVDACDGGWWNHTPEVSDGCEYECTVAAPPVEVCNGDDDDCNGVTDDVADLAGDCAAQVSDPRNVHAWQCTTGTCDIQACTGGWTDANHDADDGCETACTPDPPEDCNDEDDDCDGLTDEPGANGCDVYYRDEDRDGAGLESDSLCLCQPAGIYDTVTPGDCDDTNAAALPGGTEVCDADDTDEDCDGGADDADPEGATGALLYFADGDGDGYGDAGATGELRCDPGAGLSATADDCDDLLGGVNPGAEESLAALGTCTDGLDNDCDQATDGADTRCAPWWDCAFGFRRRIVIQSDEVVADQTDFPVLIFLPDDADLANDVQDNGNDIAFASEDGSAQYSHEIEQFDGDTGELAAWVELPALSGSVDTVFYLYYGASGGSREDVPGVWSNGYEAVYHLHDDLDDSTGAHHATNSGSQNIDGRIADGQEVEIGGYADHIDLGNWSVAGTGLTIQAWTRVESWAREDGRILSKANGTDEYDHVFMLGSVGENHRVRLRVKTGIEDSSGTTTLVAGSGRLRLDAWHLTAGTYDGSTMRVFLDGDEVGSTDKSGSLRENGWDLWAGDNPGVSRGLDGTLDEVRISSVARDEAWLQTEYNNQMTPADFHTVEPEELRPVVCP